MCSLRSRKTALNPPFKCQRMPASRWLPRGHRLLDSDAQFCTVVRGLPKPRPGFEPAGLSKTNKTALKQWEEHGCRYLPYQYELKDLVNSMKGEEAAPLTNAAQETLLCRRPDPAYLAMKTQDRQSNPVAFKDLRCSLLENRPHRTVVLSKRPPGQANGQRPG